MSGGTGMQRLDKALSARREQGGKALVLYLMAGDPDIAFTERIVPLLAEAGADVIELGFPFSDPIADGPVIQAAGNRALNKFAGLGDYLAMVGRIRAKAAVPLVLMTHFNPIFRYGESKFLRDAAHAGLCGAIVPDVPVDEALDWIALCRDQGVAPVLLEAPNTDEAHAKRIAEAGGGFIYMVSLKGVTGTDAGLGDNLGERVERFRAWGTATPLIVGFGISTPAQARDVSRLCDGVVIGSALVQRIGDAKNAAAAERAAVDYVRGIRAALDEA